MFDGYFSRNQSFGISDPGPGGGCRAGCPDAADASSCCQKLRIEVHTPRVSDEEMRTDSAKLDGDSSAIDGHSRWKLCNEQPSDTKHHPR